MDKPFLALPGEGETTTITRKRYRQECEICGEPAMYKLTFLLPNARTNPASSGYRGDDISRCEDACRFVCKDHEKRREMDGYHWCSTFPASARFAHLFLYWMEVKP